MYIAFRKQGPIHAFHRLAKQPKKKKEKKKKEKKKKQDLVKCYFPSTIPAATITIFPS